MFLSAPLAKELREGHAHLFILATALQGRPAQDSLRTALRTSGLQNRHCKGSGNACSVFPGVTNGCQDASEGLGHSCPENQAQGASNLAPLFPTVAHQMPREGPPAGEDGKPLLHFCFPYHQWCCTIIIIGSSDPSQRRICPLPAGAKSHATAGPRFLAFPEQPEVPQTIRARNSFGWPSVRSLACKSVLSF